MKPNEYQTLAMETQADQEVLHTWQMTQGVKATQLQNGVRGLTDEVGELNAALKRWLEYKKELDEGNLLEECGDVLWRTTQILTAIGKTLEEAMESNLRKLGIRYEEGFTFEEANNRDLEQEEQVFDDGRKLTELQDAEIRNFGKVCDANDIPTSSKKFIEAKEVLDSLSFTYGLNPDNYALWKDQAFAIIKARRNAKTLQDSNKTITTQHQNLPIQEPKLCQGNWGWGSTCCGECVACINSRPSLKNLSRWASESSETSDNPRRVLAARRCLVAVGYQYGVKASVYDSWDEVVDAIEKAEFSKKMDEVGANHRDADDGVDYEKDILPFPPEVNKTTVELIGSIILKRFDTLVHDMGSGAYFKEDIEELFKTLADEVQ